MDGRDENGRFGAGNKLQRNGGRKKRETEQRLLDVLRGCVPDAEAKAIIQQAVKDAKTGDDKARKWLFDYLLGPPVQRVAPTDPSGEYEYRGIDLERLTDEEVAQLAAIATRFTGDPEGGAAA